MYVFYYYYFIFLVHQCDGRNVCVPQNLYTEARSPSTRLFGGRDLGRGRGLGEVMREGAPMMGLVSLEAEEETSAPSLPAP